MGQLNPMAPAEVAGHDMTKSALEDEEREICLANLAPMGSINFLPLFQVVAGGSVAQAVRDGSNALTLSNSLGSLLRALDALLSSLGGLLRVGVGAPPLDLGGPVKE